VGRGGSNYGYPPELREWAIRMVAEVRPEYPSDWPAMEAAAKRLGIGSAETLRKWVQYAAAAPDGAAELAGLQADSAAPHRPYRGRDRGLPSASHLAGVPPGPELFQITQES
jgi:transposase